MIAMLVSKEFYKSQKSHLKWGSSNVYATELPWQVLVSLTLLDPLSHALLIRIHYPWIRILTLCKVTISMDNVTLCTLYS